MDAKAMRERLEREKADLAATVQRIQERLSVSQRDSGEIAVVDQHPADAASETEARELDVARQAMFEARHMGFSQQRGSFAKSTGKIMLDRAAKKGSVEIVIDTTSIRTYPCCRSSSSGDARR